MSALKLRDAGKRGKRTLYSNEEFNKRACIGSKNFAPDRNGWRYNMSNARRAGKRSLGNTYETSTLHCLGAEFAIF